MPKAEEIIDLRNRELSAQGNIRDLWQRTADQMYPYVDITSMSTPGSVKTDEIYDMTPYLDMCDMVSGVKQILIPSGQPFFAIKIKGNKPNDISTRYTSLVTEISHEEIYKSNFITEFDEVLKPLIVFGLASLYVDWTVKTGLNYKSPVIGTFQLLENARKIVDGIIVTVNYTARQAYEEFGDKVGQKVIEAYNDNKKQNDMFEFIYLVRPRQFDPNKSQNYSMNMPFESCIVNVKEKLIVV